jgi:hypothetical protein
MRSYPHYKVVPQATSLRIVVPQATSLRKIQHYKGVPQATSLRKFSYYKHLACNLIFCKQDACSTVIVYE